MNRLTAEAMDYMRELGALRGRLADVVARMRRLKEA